MQAPATFCALGIISARPPIDQYLQSPLLLQGKQTKLCFSWAIVLLNWKQEQQYICVFLHTSCKGGSWRNKWGKKAAAAHQLQTLE